MIEKPWAFIIRVPYMNPTTLGFLNQLPTLLTKSSRAEDPEPREPREFRVFADASLEKAEVAEMIGKRVLLCCTGRTY